MNALFIPFLGINGAAIASLIAELIVFLYFIWIMHKSLNIKFLFHECYKPLIASIGILLIVSMIKAIIQNYILRILFSILFAVIIYFGILVLLNFSLIKNELNILKSKIHSLH